MQAYGNYRGTTSPVDPDERDPELEVPIRMNTESCLGLNGINSRMYDQRVPLKLHELFRELLTMSEQLPLGHHEILTINPLSPVDNDGMTGGGFKGKTIFMRWSTVEWAQRFRQYIASEQRGFYIDDKPILMSTFPGDRAIRTPRVHNRPPRANQWQNLTWAWMDAVATDDPQYDGWFK